MKIEEIIWLREVVDKLWSKHRVSQDEVEEVLASGPKIRFVEKGDRKGENVYEGLGRTDAGRYLVVLFIYKGSKAALILSARDMATKERKLYAKNKPRKKSKRSISELIEWFDRTDTGDYLEKMSEVEFEIDIKRRRHLVELKPDLAAGVNRIAKAKKVTSESLINSWVRDKISRERLRQ